MSNIRPEGVTAGVGGVWTKGGGLGAKSIKGKPLTWISSASGDFTATGISRIARLRVTLADKATYAVTEADFGSLIAATFSTGATTVRLPAPVLGAQLFIAQTVNQNLVIIGGTADDNNSIIADGVATSDKVSFETANHKIGGCVQVIGLVDKWLIVNVSSATMTIEAAD
jgi:hypothetical protein